MSNKLCYYRCFVTKNNKTEEYGYGLTWNDIRKEVDKHYKDGADAVDDTFVVVVPPVVVVVV